ncbi:MAG: tetratricopeptide repeat protein, partial [Chloroflexota bacterium]
DECPALIQTLSDMQSLPLGRLTDDNMVDLAAAMLGTRGQCFDILQRLQQETEGNAFFAVEVLRTLAEDMGGLSNIGDAPLPDMLLPDGIQSIVQRRLARVPQRDHHLLQLAAVAGRMLDMHIINELSGHVQLEQWLTTCAEAAVLDLVDDTWRFQHAKMRDGLLATIPADIAKQHHQQVAQAIECVYPDDPQYAAQLMQHWRQAENPEKEYTYAYQAGTHAASTYANDDAITYLTRAYELARSLDWVQDAESSAQPSIKRQYDSLLVREEVYGLIGEREQQKADIALLTPLADKLDHPEYDTEIALRQANYSFEQSDSATAHMYAERAIANARLLGNNQLLSMAYRVMGGVHTLVGAFGPAKDTLENALTVAKNLAQTAEMGNILADLGKLAYNQGHYHQSVDYYRQSLHLHKTIDHAQGEATALLGLSAPLAELTHDQEAMRHLEESLATCERIGDKLGESKAANDIAILLHHFDSDKAYPFFQRSLSITQQIGYKEGLAMTLGNIGYMFARQGRPEEAYGYQLKALQIATDIEDKHNQAHFMASIGFTWRNHIGVLEQSQQYLEDSIALSGSLDIIDIEAYGTMGLGVLFNQLGFFKRAEPFLTDALTTLRTIGSQYYQGDALRYLGECFAAQGLVEPAKQHLQEAVTVNRKVHNLPLVGIALNQLAWLAYQEGLYAPMLDYYQEALTTSGSDNAPHEQAVSRAGIAWATFLINGTVSQSDITACLAYIESDPPLLMQSTPFRLHLICYKCLQAAGDPRADTLLTITREQIQQIASYIETPEWRDSFLSGVPEQRELEELYTQLP